MKKKIVSALLCATMLTGMLAGCGSKTDTNNTQQAAATGDTENVSTSDDGKVLVIINVSLDEIDLNVGIKGIDLLTGNCVDKKVELLKIYKSQSHVVDEHIHLASYEDWVRASEW